MHYSSSGYTVGGGDSALWGPRVLCRPGLSHPSTRRLEGLPSLAHCWRTGPQPCWPRNAEKPSGWGGVGGQ